MKERQLISLLIVLFYPFVCSTKTGDTTILMSLCIQLCLYLYLEPKIVMIKKKNKTKNTHCRNSSKIILEQIVETLNTHFNKKWRS